MFVCLALFGLVDRWWSPRFGGILMTLLVTGAPVFAVGLLEDLTKRVAPWLRLCLPPRGPRCRSPSCTSGRPSRAPTSGAWTGGSFSVGAAALSVFAVAGIANAINIIDGFNGLASMCVMMMLLAVAYVALQVNDGTVLALAVVGAGACSGSSSGTTPQG